MIKGTPILFIYMRPGKPIKANCNWLDFRHFIKSAQVRDDCLSRLFTRPMATNGIFNPHRHWRRL